MVLRPPCLLQTLSIPDIPSLEYTSISFSPDGKLVAAQGGSPDCCLTVWGYDKGKVVGQIKSSSSSAAPVNQVRAAPRMVLSCFIKL
jgi:WD40 repeat protein